MNVHSIFPTLFTDERLKIDNNSLLEYATAMRDQQDTDRAGGWQSAWLDLTASELAPLVSEVQAHLDKLSREVYTFPDHLTIKLANGWFNFNDPGVEQLNNNYYHLHGGFFTSTVYYIDVEHNSGNLVLIPPHSFLDYALPFQLVQQMNQFTAQRFHVLPETGKLVSFPSWINHFAEPNRSNSTRVCVAFNGVIDER